MIGLLSCLAWKVSEEELAQRQAAESRLKAQNPRAFELRERMILEHGRPGSRYGTIIRLPATLPECIVCVVTHAEFSVRFDSLFLVHGRYTVQHYDVASYRAYSFCILLLQGRGINVS